MASKLLPLSLLIKATPEVRRSNMTGFEQAVRSEQNNCNKKLQEGAFGEAWKVCSTCVDGSCSVCSQCLVVKFTKNPAEPLPTDEVMAQKNITDVFSTTSGYPIRNICKMVSVQPSTEGLLTPFIELIEGVSITKPIGSKQLEDALKASDLSASEQTHVAQEIKMLKLVAPAKASTVTDLFEAWFANHDLVTDAEWRSINLQLFGTLGDLRRAFRRFKHNDCHSSNVMLGVWGDAKSQVYNGRTKSYRLPPQRYTVKLIDYGQVTSKDSRCDTAEGNAIWGGLWEPIQIVDFTRFSLNLMDAVIKYKEHCPPALLTWFEFCLRQLAPEDRKIGPVPVQEDRLFALSDSIREYGVSEEFLFTRPSYSVVDVVDDPYFEMFQV